MSVNKKNIVKKIANESLITSSLEASQILESFLTIIKKNIKEKDIKLNGFGTFSIKKTPKRIGRNPKNLQSYIIKPNIKVTFKTSKKIKELIN